MQKGYEFKGCIWFLFQDPGTRGTRCNIRQIHMCLAKHLLFYTKKFTLLYPSLFFFHFPYFFFNFILVFFSRSYMLFLDLSTQLNHVGPTLV